MRTARLTLLGLALSLLAACGTSEPTAPQTTESSDSASIQNCGYLGSPGCM